MGGLSHRNSDDFITYRKQIAAAGTAERVIPWLQDTTIAFVEGGGSADTITDSNSNFINKGFFPGMRVTISGATNSENNGTFTVDTVVAGTLTLSTDDDLVVESAGATVTVQAANSDLPIPDGMTVAVKAKPGNTSNIIIGNSSITADSDNTFGFTLQPNESVHLSIDGLKRAWFDAVTNDEGIEVITEF